CIATCPETNRRLPAATTGEYGAFGVGIPWRSGMRLAIGAKSYNLLIALRLTKRYHSALGGSNSNAVLPGFQSLCGRSNSATGWLRVATKDDGALPKRYSYR